MSHKMKEISIIFYDNNYENKLELQLKHIVNVQGNFCDSFIFLLDIAYQSSSILNKIHNF